MEIDYNEIFIEDTCTIDLLEKKGDSKKVKTLYIKKTHIHNYKFQLDINTSIYPLKKGDVLTFQLTNMINKEKGFGKELYYVFGNKNKMHDLIKKYDYVVQGTIYDNKKNKKCISFGGLIMKIECTEKLEVGKNIYLLIKKISSL